MTILLAVPAHAYQKPANFDTTVQGGVLFQNAMVDTTVNKVGKFSHNKAKQGGAFYAMGGTMRFPNTVKFTSNTATNGGGVFFAGGKIDLLGAVEFSSNKGGGEGGMALNYVAADSNALYFATEPTMTNNTGGTYNQTYKHCYVGTEKRPNCCPSGANFNESMGECVIVRSFKVVADDCLTVYFNDTQVYKSPCVYYFSYFHNQNWQRWNSFSAQILTTQRTAVRLEFGNYGEGGGFVLLDGMTNKSVTVTSATCSYSRGQYSHVDAVKSPKNWFILPYICQGCKEICTFNGYVEP